MKASFLKRLGAFIIDSAILSFVFAIITIGFQVDTKSINAEGNDGSHRKRNLIIIQSLQLLLSHPQYPFSTVS